MFGSFFFSAHILNSLLVGLAGGDVAHRPVFKALSKLFFFLKTKFPNTSETHTHPN